MKTKLFYDRTLLLDCCPATFSITATRATQSMVPGAEPALDAAAVKTVMNNLGI